ncbi:protein TIFY 8-like isoform X2 [Papaver somniferum]|uniref:protein TIFY 8-like isoform X2 n=1 Tax=Papaver somniferum TaxID=3469 RepID=UPI000E705ABE|nr:protein TIFY 8-like isoform X2 [Papaver somniferum]
MALVLQMMTNQQQNPKTISTEAEKINPTFHDFLGMKCISDSPHQTPSPIIVIPKQSNEIKPSEASSSGGGHTPVSATSDLASERLVGNNSEGVQLHGSKSDFSGPEISNRFAGSKRSNSDSVFMGSARDRMTPQSGTDSFESSHLMKPPGVSRPDSGASKLERPLQMNASPSSQYTPRHGQFSTYIDKLSSNKYRDGNSGVSIISQPAADEGSRTGIKGSSILNGITASNPVLDRNSPRVILSGKPKYASQILDLEPSNPPSQHGLASGCRQMTIFYGGQAHVFDDVHPNKADVIMSLAGSNGGSWSTTYAQKPAVKVSIGETILPSGANELGVNNLALPRELRGNLVTSGSSSHLFDKDRQTLGSSSGPLNFSSGGRQGHMIASETRIPSQVVKYTENEGKRDVR